MSEYSTSCRFAPAFHPSLWPPVLCSLPPLSPYRGPTVADRHSTTLSGRIERYGSCGGVDKTKTGKITEPGEVDVALLITGRERREGLARRKRSDEQKIVSYSHICDEILSRPSRFRSRFRSSLMHADTCPIPIGLLHCRFAPAFPFLTCSVLQRNPGASQSMVSSRHEI